MSQLYLFTNNSSSYDLEEEYTYPVNIVILHIMMLSNLCNTTSEAGNLTSGSVNFTNAGSDDFTLGAGSVCIDAGTATGAPSVDFAETDTWMVQSSDMGCYEAATISKFRCRNHFWCATRLWHKVLILVHLQG